MVIDGLCRLLLNTVPTAPVIIIDHDRVEEHNLLRQNFQKEDIGKFKAQVLAERCARKYGRPVGYVTMPYDKDIDGTGDFHSKIIQQALIIGCVDNPVARRAIHESLIGSYGNWWIDAGNAFHSGQVLFGNIPQIDAMRGAFHEGNNRVEGLPAPSVQMPSLLEDLGEPVKQDCAEAVQRNDQSPVINQAMAVLVLDLFYKLLIGELYYMGAFLDLEAGTLRRVPTDPAVVSRMLNMPERDLIEKGGNNARTNSNPRAR